jgi:SulP family sulfate permease
MIARDGPPVASVRLTEPLLPKVMQPRGLDQLRRIPIAAFLTVLADVTATSFGALLLPAATGLPASAGVHLYLMSTTMGQLAASLFSGFPYATAGATIELVPLLIPITALLDPQWPACHRASTLLAAYTMTSALVGFLLL